MRHAIWHITEPCGVFIPDCVFRFFHKRSIRVSNPFNRMDNPVDLPKSIDQVTHKGIEPLNARLKVLPPFQYSNGPFVKQCGVTPVIVCFYTGHRQCSIPDAFASRILLYIFYRHCQAYSLQIRNSLVRKGLRRPGVAPLALSRLLLRVYSNVIR